MAAAASAAPYPSRVGLIQRLNRRNRAVAGLRIVVPAIGLVALLGLVTQIWWATLARQYGIAGFHVDRGQLVVEAPQFAGMTGNGARYLVRAEEASAPIDQPQAITLHTATLEYQRVDQATLFAASDSAVVDTSRQVVDVPGTARVSGSDGLTGTLGVVHADLRAGTATSDGPVAITFSDGTTLDAATMHYDGTLWQFSRVEMVVPMLPRRSEP